MIDDVVYDIVELLGEYFNVDLCNDEIYDLIENAVYDFIGNIEFDLNEWERGEQDVKS